jgi:hypothetical protein
VYLSTTPIGGYHLSDGETGPGKIFIDRLQAALVQAAPDIFHIAITGTDPVIGETEVAVAGAINFLSVSQTSRPEGFSGVAA